MISGKTNWVIQFIKEPGFRGRPGLKKLVGD